MFTKKDRKLGVAEGKRQYDLPLNKAEGSGFLILLISLMTFLAVIALAASFVLGAMTQRWTSGLENRLTVEIPAENEEGVILPNEDVKTLTADIAAALSKHPAVKNTEILGEEEIQELVSPWLGDDMVLKDIPLPGLISVQLHITNPDTLKVLENKVKDITPTARLDTHQTWLNDLLRFTGAMQFAAAMITLIIGVTTVTAVAGAIRSRMAEHRAEVELLHLMGAKDDYITEQFQRHALLLTLKGSTLGVLAGALVMTFISLISGDTAAALVPDFKLNALHMITLFLLPVIACAISAFTARHTVLHVLADMP